MHIFSVLLLIVILCMLAMKEFSSNTISKQENRNKIEFCAKIHFAAYPRVKFYEENNDLKFLLPSFLLFTDTDNNFYRHRQ